MNLRIFITGANGQLGRALAKKYPNATAVGRQDLDISDMTQVEAVNWSEYDVILNAAAYVNADNSETVEGRRMAWKSNGEGVRNLTKVAMVHKLHLIHFSSEYVFDGVLENHQEDEPLSPLSVYGQTKAAGDLMVSILPHYHVLRTTWVIGDGHNFVRTMKRLGDMRIDPKVVDDQFGRLTFTSELVRAVDHVLTKNVESGVYNVSNSGEIRSWFDIATMTYRIAGHDPSRVKAVSTEEYCADKVPFAPRPTHSELDLTKIQQTGFVSQDYEHLMEEYIASLGNLK